MFVRSKKSERYTELLEVLSWIALVGGLVMLAVAVWFSVGWVQDWVNNGPRLSFGSLMVSLTSLLSFLLLIATEKLSASVSRRS